LDNITHSLAGIAIADAVMGKRAAGTQRPMLIGAGMIAANLPDLDLVYTVITPSPVGYLLHHRGHTHTVVGIVVLAALVILSYWWVPSVRGMRVFERLRFWLVIVAGLVSHLLFDALNSYGVHPFYPSDNQWYFGDAVFIFEPLIWVVLGAAAIGSARTRAARIAVGVPLLVLLFTVAFLPALPLASVGGLALVGGTMLWLTRPLSNMARGAVALATTAAIGAGLSALSREARAATVQALAPELRGRLVDVVLTPNPTSPLCWSVIGIEVDERGDEYILRRGTLSLVPDIIGPETCASHRLPGASTLRMLGGTLALRDEIRQDLSRLRDRAAGDCWTRAWLRFGRAPVIAGDHIFDLRFAERQTRNFSHMTLTRRPNDPRCPSFVPPWDMPRADLLISR
jgi:inner membrane protein